MSFIKNTTVLSLVLLSISGCSVKSLNKDFKNAVDKNYIDPIGKERNYLKDKVHERVLVKNHLDLSIKKNISTLLKELSEIDGNVYLYKGEDIEIPACTNSDKLNINSFKKLNAYIRDTTNFTMVITKNRFIKGRVKIVELKDLQSLQSNLSKIPFYIRGSYAISDALYEISKMTGFNIVYKIDKSQEVSLKSLENGEGLDNIFAGKYITFSGNNVADFLTLLSNNYNLFVDIDYKNKLIIFSKYKGKVFHVFVNNINLSGSLSGTQAAAGNSAAASSKLPIDTHIKIDILADLEKNLKDIIGANSRSTLSFNKTSGQIYVKADKQTMENITKVINDFNSIFNKQVDFELDIYEFAVSKEFDGGISVGGEVKYRGGTITGQSNELIKDLFTFTKTAGGGTYKANLNLTNKMVQLIQSTSHGYVIKNNMPYMIDLTNSKDYVKTIKVTTSSTTAGETKITSPETDTISEGTILTVLPRILGKKIELNIEPNIVTINKISTETYDGNTISLPDISTNKFKSNIMIKSGERRVIGYVTQYQDISDYNGVIPLDHFIIGGENDKKYIRKEIIFVVSARVKN